MQCIDLNPNNSCFKLVQLEFCQIVGALIFVECPVKLHGTLPAIQWMLTQFVPIPCHTKHSGLNLMTLGNGGTTQQVFLVICNQLFTFSLFLEENLFTMTVGNNIACVRCLNHVCLSLIITIFKLIDNNGICLAGSTLKVTSRK